MPGEVRDVSNTITFRVFDWEKERECQRRGPVATTTSKCGTRATSGND
ncbi:hypothetical protein Hdeb2414_s0247g00847011 [Helianthus debilis subsp. tardiflorus]